MNEKNARKYRRSIILYDTINLRITTKFIFVRNNWMTPTTIRSQNEWENIRKKWNKNHFFLSLLLKSNAYNVRVQNEMARAIIPAGDFRDPVSIDSLRNEQEKNNFFFFNSSNICFINCSARKLRVVSILARSHELLTDFLRSHDKRKLHNVPTRINVTRTMSNFI